LEFRLNLSAVPPEETIEIMAFIQAEQASKEANGAPVKLSDVIAKAGAMKP